MCHNNINSDDAIKGKKKKVGAIPVKGAQWDERELCFLFSILSLYERGSAGVNEHFFMKEEM